MLSSVLHSHCRCSAFREAKTLPLIFVSLTIRCTTSKQINCKLSCITLICVAPCIFVILVNFVANECTLFICFCTSLYKFADMFRPVWIIIGASHV
jgi:hypothetical protein